MYKHKFFLNLNEFEKHLSTFAHSMINFFLDLNQQPFTGIAKCWSSNVTASRQEMNFTIWKKEASNQEFFFVILIVYGLACGLFMVTILEYHD